MTPDDEKQICNWCQQERHLVTGVATVHLPELAEKGNERQSASAQRQMALCGGCAHFHETQEMLRSPNGNPPVHDAALYADAARRGFFTTWDKETEKISDDDIETLIEIFFEGIDVTIERVSYGAGCRHGFNITLNSLPEHQVVFTGQDRSKVPFMKQMIAVQNKENFHAGTMGLVTARALAVGLAVFVRNSAIMSRRYLAERLEHYRASKGAMGNVPAGS